MKLKIIALVLTLGFIPFSQAQGIQTFFGVSVNVVNSCDDVKKEDKEFCQVQGTIVPKALLICADEFNQKDEFCSKVKISKNSDLIEINF